MKEVELIVGKYSTWSIRVFTCMRMLGLSPKLTIIDLDNEDDRAKLSVLSDTKLVPVLISGELKIHDSLAITEYLNEMGSTSLYPDNINNRAMARSLCSELHSGFVNLRTECPFTFNTSVTPEITEVMAAELERLKCIWSKANNPFMYSSSSAVDAYYAVIAFRLAIYGIKFEGIAGDYQDSLLSWEIFSGVIEAAKGW